MTAAELRLRSQVLGTQTLAQDSAMRVGVVNQVWVDLEQKQVLALDVLRGQVFGGDVTGLEFARVGAFGRDAILVENEDVFDNLDTDDLSRVIGSSVVTDAGVALGRIRDFAFDPETGEIAYFILSNLGIPYLPGILDSTYEMAAAEILKGGGDRIIVAESTETRLTVLQRSFLETTFGIGKPPWMVEEFPTALPSAAVDEDAEDYYEDEYADEYEEEETAEPEYGESVYDETDEPQDEFAEDEPFEDESDAGVEDDYIPDTDIKDEYEEAAEAMESTEEEELDTEPDADEVNPEPEGEPFEPPVDIKEEELTD
ncbi:MAG: PRC-barrel domain-containing protein [Cyanobacteria bacterium P01_F01_bin.33]